jgi:hypothetical protein
LDWQGEGHDHGKTTSISRGALPGFPGEDVRAALQSTDVMVEVDVESEVLKFPRLNCRMAFDHLNRLFHDRFQLLTKASYVRHLQLE